MIDTPKIAQSAAVMMAFIRLTIRREEIHNVMGPGLTELMTALAEQGIAPTGPWFTHHLRMEPKIFDCEICLPVETPVTPVGRVKQGELPATKVARTVYHGGYEGLSDAWGEFDAWIAANGLKTGPDLWEVYLAGPESGSNANDFRTELNRSIIG